MTNSYGENVDEGIRTNTENTDGEWQSVEPVSVENDEELQAALNGEPENEQDERELNLDASSWEGMEDGALAYNSTQNSNWLETIPPSYHNLANRWASQQGMIKIIPVQQKQKFTYSTVSYIASNQAEPKTQVFPICDVSVVPHQITFDFYDTTEGRVGVSNAVEKHMEIEFDVYLTDLLAQFWIFGENDEYILEGTTLPNVKKEFWTAIENGTYLDFEGDLEKTTGFSDFRATFLQQHSGWVCKFVSHIFGVFQGVITDVSYQIGAGESFAKWHVKLEEAIFTDAYSETGQKPSEDTGTSEGSTENSGEITNTG